MEIIINILAVIGAVNVVAFLIMIVALLKAKEGGKYEEELFFNGSLCDYDSIHDIETDSSNKE